MINQPLQAVKWHFTILVTKEVGHINLIPIIDGSIREKSIYAEVEGFEPTRPLRVSAFQALAIDH